MKTEAEVDLGKGKTYRYRERQDPVGIWSCIRISVILTPWNPVVIDDNSNGETVVTGEVVRKENKVPILILPPGQLVEIIDYKGEEFIPAGGGLEGGLEIKRAQADPAPEYDGATLPEYAE